MRIQLQQSCPAIQRMRFRCGLLAARRNNHGDVVAFVPRLLLYGKFARKRLLDLLEHPHAQFGTDIFATAEEHRNLRLVSLIEKTPHVSDLQFKVVLGNLGPDLHLFDIGRLLVRMLLAHLILVLAVIHNTANRGLSRSCNFNQIEPFVSRHLKRLHRWYDAMLGAFVVDQTHFANSDSLIYSDNVLADTITSMGAGKGRQSRPSANYCLS